MCWIFLFPGHKTAVNKKRLVICRVGERQLFWNWELQCRWSTLTLDINNLVRSPGRPQPHKSTASSTCRSSPFCAILLMTARWRFSFVFSPHPPGGSEPTPVSPCYDGSHTCATTARCHPATGVAYTCECASGYQGDGRSCVGKTLVLCVPPLRPPAFCP